MNACVDNVYPCRGFLLLLAFYITLQFLHRTKLLHNWHKKKQKLNENELMAISDNTLNVTMSKHNLGKFEVTWERIFGSRQHGHNTVRIRFKNMGIAQYGSKEISIVSDKLYDLTLTSFHLCSFFSVDCWQLKKLRALR